MQQSREEKEMVLQNAPLHYMESLCHFSKELESGQSETRRSTIKGNTGSSLIG